MHPGFTLRCGIECYVHLTYPFAVDGHLGFIINAQIFHFRDVTDALHVGSVATCSENDSNLSLGVDIRGGYQSASGVVDQGCEFDWEFLILRICWSPIMSVSSVTYMLSKRFLEHLCDILPFGILDSKTFCPTNEFAMINLVLPDNISIRGALSREYLIGLTSRDKRTT
jgi:hypothetical protein